MVLAAIFTASKVDAALGKLVVRVIRGAASFAETGGAYKALKVGKVVGPCSTIRTSAESTVDLFLGANGPTLRILTNTTVSMDKLTVDDVGNERVIETIIDLKAGSIKGYARKFAMGSKYEVKTLNGVANIRGALYEISANGTIVVQEGSVQMAIQVDGAIQTFTVNAGQMLTPSAIAGGAPTIGSVPRIPETIFIDDFRVWPEPPEPPPTVISPTNPAAPAIEQQP